jgi:hypothetical protein
MANPDLRASTRYSDGGDHTAGKVEDWVANARAADLTFFIFDGAADPADLRRFAASVSGSSYWVLWLGARLRPHDMAAVRPSKNVQPIGWRTAKLAYRDYAVFAAGVR